MAAGFDGWNLSGVSHVRPDDGGFVCSNIPILQSKDAVATLLNCGACLWLRNGTGQEKSDPGSIEEQFLQEGKAILCRNCGHLITGVDAKIFIDGSQTHTFFNPVGIVYEIICVSQAPGCSVVGAASAEFSWFSGFTWRAALCRRCRRQLGWCFESGDSAFFGLIRKELSGNI
jgi:hypothetical protein